MRILAQALAGFAFLAGISQASAAVINLEPPDDVAGLGNVYSQDGFTFTNSLVSPVTYFNWKYYGGTDYDADYPGSTLDVNFPDTINTITKTGGGSFFFGGISLADIYNTGNGGNVTFAFNYADGTSSTDTVTLAMRSGLQAFAFNQANVLSVDITGDPARASGDLQFDYLVAEGGAVSAVPLPASLPMFGAAIFALGGFGYGLIRRASLKEKSAPAA